MLCVFYYNFKKEKKNKQKPHYGPPSYNSNQVSVTVTATRKYQVWKCWERDTHVCPPAVFRVIPCCLPLGMPSPLQDVARFLRLSADRVCVHQAKSSREGALVGVSLVDSFSGLQSNCLAAFMGQLGFSEGDMLEP